MTVATERRVWCAICETEPAKIGSNKCALCDAIAATLRRYDDRPTRCNVPMLLSGAWLYIVAAVIVAWAIWCLWD